MLISIKSKRVQMKNRTNKKIHSVNNYTEDDADLILLFPGYTETPHPQLDAIRKFQILTQFNKRGMIKDSYTEEEKQLINEFSILNEEERLKQIQNLKALFSKA